MSLFIWGDTFHVPSRLTRGGSCSGAFRHSTEGARRGEEAVLSEARSRLDGGHGPLFSSPRLCFPDPLSSRSLFGLFSPLQSGERDIITKRRERSEQAHGSLPLRDCTNYYFKLVYLKVRAEKFFPLLQVFLFFLLLTYRQTHRIVQMIHE